MKLLSLILAAWPIVDHTLLYCKELNVYFQVPPGYCTQNGLDPNPTIEPSCDVSSYCKTQVPTGAPHKVSNFEVTL